MLTQSSVSSRLELPKRNVNISDIQTPSSQDTHSSFQSFTNSSLYSNDIFNGSNLVSMRNSKGISMQNSKEVSDHSNFNSLTNNEKNSSQNENHSLVQSYIEPKKFQTSDNALQRNSFEIPPFVPQKENSISVSQNHTVPNGKPLNTFPHSWRRDALLNTKDWFQSQKSQLNQISFDNQFPSLSMDTASENSKNTVLYSKENEATELEKMMMKTQIRNVIINKKNESTLKKWLDYPSISEKKVQKILYGIQNGKELVSVWIVYRVVFDSVAYDAYGPFETEKEAQETSHSISLLVQNRIDEPNHAIYHHYISEWVEKKNCKWNPNLVIPNFKPIVFEYPVSIQIQTNFDNWKDWCLFRGVSQIPSHATKTPEKGIEKMIYTHMMIAIPWSDQDFKTKSFLEFDPLLDSKQKPNVYVYYQSASRIEQISKLLKTVRKSNIDEPVYRNVFYCPSTQKPITIFIYRLNPQHPKCERLDEKIVKDLKKKLVFGGEIYNSHLVSSLPNHVSFPMED